jgi:hypothetical protein
MEPEETTARRAGGYFWILGPRRMFCFANGKTQTVDPKLWEAEAATETHDEHLMGLTTKINEILTEVQKKPPEPGLELSLIKFRRRYMLAWTEPVRGGTRSR